VLPGYNLVRWDGANDGAAYGVYRKTVDADNNPIDASILALGNGAQTTNLKLWYYQDSAVKDGEKYQYGIVTIGYKDGSAGTTGTGATDSGSDVIVRSESAWQAETEGKLYAAASVPAKGAVYQVPSTPPTVVIKAINSNKPAAVDIPATSVDTADQILVTVSGLDLNYKYDLLSQSSSDGVEVNYTAGSSVLNSNAGNDIWTYNATASTTSLLALKISNYLENGTTLSLVVSSPWGGGLVSATTTQTYRLVIEYDTADSNGVLEYTLANTAVSPLDTNQVQVGLVPKS
jgi:hypothetical protein